MPMIGLNFDKIVADKMKPVKAPLKINSNLTVTSLEKSGMDAPKGFTMLRFNFEFKLNYEPKTAEILVGGHVLYSEKDKEADAMLGEWKKSKKVNPDLVRNVINAAIIRSNIKALLMEQEIGLPPHIKFPIVAPKQGSSYIG